MANTCDVKGNRILETIPEKKDIHDIDISGKRIFLRVDYNVPLKDGMIQDCFKICQSFETIKEILRKNPSKLIIGSHLGRPKNREVQYSMEPIQKYLNTQLDMKFVLMNVGDDLSTNKFIILENLRFFKEEDDGFGDYFTKYADILVVDAFGAVHRNAQSIIGTNLPAVSGLLLKKELEAARHLKNIDLLILGGAKVKDKVKLIGGLKAKKFWAVGAIGLTLLKGIRNIDIGKSLFESDAPFNEISNLVNPNLPIDFVVRDGQSYKTVQKFEDNHIGVDIGEQTLKALQKDVNEANVIFWNGPPGIFEEEESSKGTLGLVDILRSRTENNGIVIIGGGDTASALRKYGKVEDVTHVSTGGGSFLTLLENGKLPGIDIIMNK